MKKYIRLPRKKKKELKSRRFVVWSHPDGSRLVLDNDKYGQFINHRNETRRHTTRR